MTKGNAEKVKTTDTVWSALGGYVRTFIDNPPALSVQGHDEESSDAQTNPNEVIRRCAFVRDPMFSDDWLVQVRVADLRTLMDAAEQAAPPEDDPEPPKDDEDEYGPDREETDDR